MGVASELPVPTDAQSRLFSLKKKISNSFQKVTTLSLSLKIASKSSLGLMFSKLEYPQATWRHSREREAALRGLFMTVLVACSLEKWVNVNSWLHGTLLTRNRERVMVLK